MDGDRPNQIAEQNKATNCGRQLRQRNPFHQSAISPPSEGSIGGIVKRGFWKVHLFSLRQNRETIKRCGEKTHPIFG